MVLRVVVVPVADDGAAHGDAAERVLAKPKRHEFGEESGLFIG